MLLFTLKSAIINYHTVELCLNVGLFITAAVQCSVNNENNEMINDKDLHTFTLRVTLFTIFKYSKNCTANISFFIH